MSAAVVVSVNHLKTHAMLEINLLLQPHKQHDHDVRCLVHLHAAVLASSSSLPSRHMGHACTVRTHLKLFCCMLCSPVSKLLRPIAAAAPQSAMLLHEQDAVDAPHQQGPKEPTSRPERHVTPRCTLWCVCTRTQHQRSACASTLPCCPPQCSCSVLLWITEEGALVLMLINTLNSMTQRVVCLITMEHWLPVLLQPIGCCCCQISTGSGSTQGTAVQLYANQRVSATWVRE